jgi:hypothetical protein
MRFTSVELSQRWTLSRYCRLTEHALSSVAHLSQGMQKHQNAIEKIAVTLLFGPYI